MAAGDGNRLGIKKAKGLFQLDLPNPKSIFEEFIDRVKAVSEEALLKYPNKALKKEAIVIYVIISSVNAKEIYDFFEANKYFGYSKVCLIETGYKINCFNEKGQIAMSTRTKFLKSSFGNGDIIELSH